MALQGNGQLLVEVEGARFTDLFSAASPVSLPGYTLQPLIPSPLESPGFDPTALALHWLLAKPPTIEEDLSPWDRAHSAAARNGYKHYIEPDILHLRDCSRRTQDNGLDADWPPHVSNAVGVSPGWHLGSDFTDFLSAHKQATGAGIRIAHLDTGYTPTHASVPRNLQASLGYDFWDNKPGAIDPGADIPLVDNPGHGTATLALLAGGNLDLSFGEFRYQGDFGGAPDAFVVPVRIGPSVIHLYTSSMAQGMLYALAPGADKKNRCDVVTTSHGGLPSAAWAHAVNVLYEAGVAVVAASGDSIYLKVVDLASHYTVYPSAFNRVVTALGVTYLKTPYITDKFGVMQGCWGPDLVMDKAIAGFTPNVAWMNYKDCPNGFQMSGGGTSASTPQVAAACALWLQLYGNRLPADWHRVEALRLALFDSADDSHPDKSELGWGLLRAAKLLDETLAEKAIAQLTSASKEAVDSVSFPFLRLILGIGPPNSNADRMYETEVSQVVHQSSNVRLRQGLQDFLRGVQFSPGEIARFRVILAGESISSALRQRILGP